MTDLAGALTVVGLTDSGMVRSHNEDSIATDPELGLIILADGMGGYNAGEIASGMATTLLGQGIRGAIGGAAVIEAFETATPRVRNILRDQVTQANAAILQASRSQPQYSGMGTTLVSALFYDNRLTSAHIGDSRLYRLRDGRLDQLTRDHSLLQEQIDSGLITAEEARFSSNKNLVTRALGIDDEVECEFNDFETRTGDIYLFCSDGLNDMVEDEDIQMVLNTLAANLPLAAEHLVQTANDNGGRDNVSVILVRVDGSYAAPRGWLQRLRNWLFR